MISQATITHLWQSTLFALAMAAMTLLFRRNRAAVRFALWLAASLKFLIPFSLIVAAASYCAPPRADLGAGLSPRIASHPVDQGTVATWSKVEETDRSPFPFGAVLAAIWLCGVARNVFVWGRQWRRVRVLLSESMPVEVGAPVRAMSAPGIHEPAVFGVLRPVLLVPDGLRQQLTDGQWQAVIAHEVAHVRRRDNLWAAAHMAVEAIFWFHPLVWWLEARLIEERERACDQAVLASNYSPDVYAEGILTVCKLYAETPLACMSGIGGSKLKNRIEAMFTAGAPATMSTGKKVVLAAMAIGALGVPATIGVVNPSRVQAQTGPRAAFEVASIKKTKQSGPGPMGWDTKSGGRFHATNIPLMMLIATAYDIPFQSSRLTGLPDWAIDRYDIDAAAEKGAIPPGLAGKALDARIRPMLQSLLADRFHLVIRRETKDLPIYALEVAKDGPKLKRSKVDEKDCDTPGSDCHSLHGGIGRGLHATAADLDDVALYVANWTDRPVINRTGLAGLYEIETEGWARMTPVLPRADGTVTAEDLAMADPSRPTVFQIFSLMGLKLSPTKGPIDMYVVEKVERPTEN